MRVLISGGPGSGCTSTAKLLGEELRIAVFDSDTYLFQPTDPPYQELRPLEERRELLLAELRRSVDWIISGSIATWHIALLDIHFAFFMDTPKDERLRRLEARERERFGRRIDEGGDMHTENTEFMKWAATYEDGSNEGRNRAMDRDFLVQQGDKFFEISSEQTLGETVAKIRGLLTEPPTV